MTTETNKTTETKTTETKSTAFSNHAAGSMLLAMCERVNATDWEPGGENLGRQVTFSESFYVPCKAEFSGGLPEVRRKAGTSDEVNAWFRKEGFPNITLDPCENAAGGIANFKMEWLKKGRALLVVTRDATGRITGEHDAFVLSPAAEDPDNIQAFFLPSLHVKGSYSSSLHVKGSYSFSLRASEVLVLRCKDRTRRLCLAVCDEQMDEQALYAKVQELRKLMNTEASPLKCEMITIPCVDLHVAPDYTWLKGARFNGQALDQVVTESIFQMDEFGAVAKAAVGGGLESTAGLYQIDSPFIAWVEDEGCEAPLFIAHCFRDCWKRPPSTQSTDVNAPVQTSEEDDGEDDSNDDNGGNE